MTTAILKPNDRYAIVGKTGSGKSRFGMVLAGVFARSLKAPWQVWWIDTKNDPDDISALREWGFRNAISEEDQATPGAVQGAYYYIISGNNNQSGMDTVTTAQTIMGMAYDRKNVIVVVDEYTQVVASSKNPGPKLLDIFTRGRGRNVGIIGLTQEPVYVPRQLLSQASHLIMFSLSYDYDRQYMKKIDPVYRSPNTMGDKWGFYWKWLDGDDTTTYYPNQKDWMESANIKTEGP